MDALLKLPIFKFRLYFRAQETIHLPDYPGATFRGAFGQTFCREICLLPRQECEPVCPLGNRCPYQYIFKTPNDGDLEWFDQSTPTAPRPYLITPTPNTPTAFRRDDIFTFDLTLVGTSVNYVTYLVYVFERMGQVKGIGKNLKNQHGRCRLEQVFFLEGNKPSRVVYENETINLQSIRQNKSGETVYNAPPGDMLRLCFLTPTRITHQKRPYELSNKMPLTFEALIRNLYRRAYLLNYFHHNCGDELLGLPTPDDIDVPDNIAVVHNKLKWMDWQRRPTGRKKVNTNGGFTGSITFSGNWRRFYPLLKFGEELHVGGMTTFGMGKYVIAAPPGNESPGLRSAGE